MLDLLPKDIQLVFSSFIGIFAPPEQTVGACIGHSGSPNSPSPMLDMVHVPPVVNTRMLLQVALRLFQCYT